MMNQITWQQYLITIGILSAVYYLFVLVRYYAADLALKRFGSNKDYSSGYDRPLRSALRQADNEPEQSSLIADPEEEDEFADVEDLISRVKKIIEQASVNGADQSDLKGYIGLTLQEFPAIKNSPLRSSVNELIESECQKYGTVTLGQDEVDLLWDTE